GGAPYAVLHPRNPDDEIVEPHRRAEEREEFLAVDVDAHRLLADHLRGHLGHVPPLSAQITTHRWQSSSARAFGGHRAPAGERGRAPAPWAPPWCDRGRPARA